MKKFLFSLLLLVSSIGFVLAQTTVSFTIQPVARQKVEALMAPTAKPQEVRMRVMRPENEGIDRKDLPDNPDAQPIASFPPRVQGLPNQAPTPQVLNVVQTVGLGFNSVTGPDETGAFPPDNMGAVGPTQFITFVNGRLRSFNKTTGVADGVLNINPDVFFASAMTTPAANEIVFTSDPRIRYDRFSGKWILVIIDVVLNSTTFEATRANRCMIAYSDGSTITNSTNWTFYQFTSSDGLFLDYPTLGIDKNLLYIGGNMFTLAGAFSKTNGYVIDRNTLLSGGAVTVTSFLGLATGAGAGPFTPQGVDNFDLSPTEGYFVGVDNATFSTIMFRRVTYNAGTPSISANIAVTVPTTVFPTLIPHLGNTGGSNGRLDGLDDRLYAAVIRNGRLWTAHSFRVSTGGVASTAAGNRNGSRWYEFQNLTTTPTLVQSGTIFDNAATNPIWYSMPTVMVSGQGHATFAMTASGNTSYINATTTSRLASDASGATTTITNLTNSSTAYNPPGDPGGAGGRRWGDYSYVSLDPLDDMTMWVIHQYCVGTNKYGCYVAKMVAPPPATPTTCSPSSIAGGQTSVSVTLTGNAVSGSGFYDPGTNLPAPALAFNHLAALVSGGVTVNSVTYNGPTSVTLDLNTVNASAGTKNITITNPDGQSLTGNDILTVTCTAPVVSAPTVTQPTCLVPTGTIVVNATGSGTLEYSVGGPYQTSNTFTGLAATNYNVSVRLQDTPGCVTNYSQNPVAINAAPTAPVVNAPTVTQPTCATPSGTIVVNATSGQTLEYSIDGAYQTSNTFSGLNPNSYTISVRLQSTPSCVINYANNPVDIVAIPEAPTMNTPSVTQPNCTVTTGTIVINATGSGTIEYSIGGAYQLSNTFSGLTPSSYAVSARLQSSPTCITNYALNPVIINAVPTAPIVNAPTVTQPTCPTPTGTIVVNATGSGPLEYSIGGSYQTSNTFTGLAATNYLISVRLQNTPSCVTNYSNNPVTIVPILAPVITTPTVTQPQCIGSTGSIVVNATGSGVLEYSIDGGSNWQASNTFNSLPPNSYSIKVRFKNTPQCVSTYASNPVLINPTSVSLTITPSVASVCVGETFSLSSVSSPSASSYSWRGPNGFSSTSQNISSVLSSSVQFGIYSLTVTVGPCTISTTAEVKIKAALSAGVVGTPCVGGTIQFTASGMSSYTWSRPTNNFNTTLSNPVIPSSTLNDAGIYFITGRGPGLCVASALVPVMLTGPGITTAFTVSPTTICAGNAVTLSATSATGTYSWTGPGGYLGNTRAINIPNFQAGNQGSYRLTLLSGLCKGYTEKNISINCAARLASELSEVPDIEVNAYPNPFTHTLTVEVTLKTPSSLKLKLTNSVGNPSGQWESTESSIHHTMDINLGSLPGGVYLLQAQASKQKAVKRVVKIQY